MVPFVLFVGLAIASVSGVQAAEMTGAEIVPKLVRQALWATALPELHA
jgi:hypothetical protein